jgi:hypothetical protein
MSEGFSPIQRPNGILDPLPAFSRLALSVRLALYGRGDPRVQYMAERNQMLAAIKKFGFALPDASA